MPSPLQNPSGGLQPVELTRGDLAALAAPRTAGSSKAKHREVARLIMLSCERTHTLHLLRRVAVERANRRGSMPSVSRVIIELVEAGRAELEAELRQ